jgi:hypothetical protein
MAATGIDLAGLVAGYSRRLHAVIGERHHVASPLGAWLLLALAGPAQRRARRTESPLTRAGGQGNRKGNLVMAINGVTTHRGASGA